MIKSIIRLFSKAQDVSVRSISQTNPDGWSEGHAAFSGEDINGRGALSLSAVWACVNLIAGTGASLPFMVYRETDAGRKVAKDHYLYRVLHDSPNYDQTAVDFWEFTLASLELWGNSYAKIDRSGGKVRAIHPVAPHIVSVKRRKTDGKIEYRWSEDGVSYVETDATMLHIRGFGGHPLGGMSTLSFGRNTFGLAKAIERAAGGMFKNGLRPSGILSMPGVLKDDQRDAIEAGLQKKFAGAVNAGKPMVLEGGVKWESLMLNPDDAQMLESRGFSVEEICRFFQVPPFMIGHTEKSTSWGTGLEQQTLGFQKFTLRRRLKRVEQAVSKQLLTPEDRARGISVEFNLEGLLRADSAGRSRFYQTMTGIGAMTINEVRSLENLPPVDGGDVPRMQMQNMPITEIDEEAVRRMIAEQSGANT